MREVRAADIEALAGRIGPENLIYGEDLSRYAVDGRVPQAVCLPASVQDVSHVLAWAHEGNRAVVPRGGGSQMGIGNPPERLDAVLSLERLDQVVAFEPADMTITVQAGMSLVRLQEHLAAAGQFLPVDPPLPREATVGGILAARSSGPLRAAFRTISDRLLGVRVVNADGRITKAGGRVVKNAAGYEVGRLYAGSLGTLAVIVEATLKVQPRFEVHEALLIEVERLSEAEAILAALRQAEGAPAFVELIGPGEAGSPGPAPPGKALLAVGFGGTREEVDWSLAEAARLIEGAPGIGERGISRRAWQEVYPALLAAHRSDAFPSLFPDLAGEPAHSLEGRPAPEKDGLAVCRAHLLPTRLVSYLEDASVEAGRAGLPLRYACHASSGIARLHLGAPDGGAGLPLDALAGAVEALRELAEEAGGFLVVESAPVPLKERVPVFGAPRDDHFLHRAVKEKLDPKRILSPGRFVGDR